MKANNSKDGVERVTIRVNSRLSPYEIILLMASQEVTYGEGDVKRINYKTIYKTLKEDLGSVADMAIDDRLNTVAYLTLKDVEPYIEAIEPYLEKMGFSQDSINDAIEKIKKDIRE